MQRYTVWVDRRWAETHEGALPQDPADAPAVRSQTAGGAGPWHSSKGPGRAHKYGIQGRSVIPSPDNGESAPSAVRASCKTLQRTPFVAHRPSSTPVGEEGRGAPRRGLAVGVSQSAGQGREAAPGPGWGAQQKVGGDKKTWPCAAVAQRRGKTGPAALPVPQRATGRNRHRAPGGGAGVWPGVAPNTHRAQGVVTGEFWAGGAGT